MVSQSGPKKEPRRLVLMTGCEKFPLAATRFRFSPPPPLEACLTVHIMCEIHQGISIIQSTRSCLDAVHQYLAEPHMHSIHQPLQELLQCSTPSPTYLVHGLQQLLLADLPTSLGSAGTCLATFAEDFENDNPTNVRLEMSSRAKPPFLLDETRLGLWKYKML
jgi:hypothetical protein